MFVCFCACIGGWVSMWWLQMRGGCVFSTKAGGGWAVTFPAEERGQWPGRTLPFLFQVLDDTGWFTMLTHNFKCYYITWTFHDISLFLCVCVARTWAGLRVKCWSVWSVSLTTWMQSPPQIMTTYENTSLRCFNCVHGVLVRVCVHFFKELFVYIIGMWDPIPPSGLAGGDAGDRLQDDLPGCGVKPQAAQGGCEGGAGLHQTLLLHYQVAPLIIVFCLPSVWKCFFFSPFL